MTSTSLTVLRADLVALAGVHGLTLLELLRERDGADLPEGWRVELEGVLSSYGAGAAGVHQAPVHEAGAPVWDGAGWRGSELGDLSGGYGLPTVAVCTDPAPLLLVWAQRLRVQLGKPLVAYVDIQPDHKEAMRRLHAGLGDLMEWAGIPRRRRDVFKRRVRRSISARHGLGSTRHLPVSLYVREADAELLRLHLAAVKGVAAFRVALGFCPAPRPKAVRAGGFPQPDPRSYPGGAASKEYRYDRDKWLEAQGARVGVMTRRAA